MLATGRLWRKVMNEIFHAEFPDIQVEHQLIDSVAMIMVKRPTQLHGVILCSNLQCDILSDEVSVIPGSIGLPPSASLCGIPDGKQPTDQGIFEPIHGGFVPIFHSTPYIYDSLASGSSRFSRRSGNANQKKKVNSLLVFFLKISQGR
jgi:isocitrate/isopropylmalate dehydrogenase